jgi:cellulose synthase/poly-beta-1,6-N-acetylglucosamine synthase-like glycosyltransferase
LNFVEEANILNKFSFVHHRNNNMLSILIPIYNYQITDLIQDLYKQIEENLVHAEIIIVDDASSMFVDENSKLNDLENVRYEKLENNIGRSAIRNYLASKAQYDYLLFIDCDAKVNNSNFIKNYVQSINENKEVVCGGLKYKQIAPIDHKLYFRWYYGIKREYRTAVDRIENPYKSFSSFNFLIRKDIFQAIKFDEKLTTYGHEDTLLGIEIKKQNRNITHVNNPLLHDGLEKTDVFIHKTKQSVKNLKYLHNNYTDKEALVKSIKLLKYINIIKKIRFSWLFNLCFKAFNNSILKNLRTQHPSLKLFDLYKICYYFSI